LEPAIGSRDKDNLCHFKTYAVISIEIPIMDKKISKAVFLAVLTQILTAFGNFTGGSISWASSFDNGEGDNLSFVYSIIANRPYHTAQSNAATYNSLGNDLMDQERFSEAEVAYREALIFAPDSGAI
jgi:hypothetical protein